MRGVVVDVEELSDTPSHTPRVEPWEKDWASMMTLRKRTTASSTVSCLCNEVALVARVQLVTRLAFGLGGIALAACNAAQRHMSVLLYAIPK